jgi:hypothetical protein
VEKERKTSQTHSIRHQRESNNNYSYYCDYDCDSFDDGEHRAFVVVVVIIILVEGRTTTSQLEKSVSRHSIECLQQLYDERQQRQSRVVSGILLLFFFEKGRR